MPGMKHLPQDIHESKAFFAYQINQQYKDHDAKENQVALCLGKPGG
jgi:hypothetical protein